MTRTAILLALAFLSFAAFAQDSNNILIPAAGSVQGANGTFFRSDITVTNLRNQSQRVEFEWMPSTGPAFGITVSIPAFEAISSEDFVSDAFGATGLGAILVSARRTGGEIDTNGHLHVTSRIWSNQPGSSGTVSQSLQTLPVDKIVNTHMAITGLRHGPRFRTNVGIVNLDDGDQTFRIRVTGTVKPLIPVEIVVNMRGRSLAQVPISWPDDPQIRIDVDVLTLPSGGRLSLWTSYASNVDNVTGDSWSFVGVDLPLQGTLPPVP